MAAIWLELRKKERLDVAAVYIQMRACVPGLRIVHEDYFKALRGNVEKIKNAEASDKPLPSMDHMLKSIDRSEAEMGPGIGIAVDLDGGALLEGYIWRKKINLSSRSSISASQIKSIQEFLYSLKIGKVDQDGFT